eukprot:5984450-Amphidinium_carterae.2
MGLWEGNSSAAMRRRSAIGCSQPLWLAMTPYKHNPNTHSPPKYKVLCANKPSHFYRLVVVAAVVAVVVVVVVAVP